MRKRMEPQGRVQVETDHVVIVATHDSVTAEASKLAAAKGERLYLAIRRILGDEPTPNIVVALNGPAARPDGSWASPHVDARGTVHLYQYTASPQSYVNALAHEMVHAFRLHRMPHHDWFFEEGFAEFVARRVDDSLDGFPWYGYPVAVVAGQWIAREEDIPLETLRTRHRIVNLTCKLQSYALRSSFFDWLGRTYGDTNVIAMATTEDTGVLSNYERFFGKPFKVLEHEWRQDLLMEYEATHDVQTLTRRYREETPARYALIRQRIQGTRR